MVMVNGEILHQKLPQELGLGPILECTKVLNLYSSNKNSLLETGLLRMFMYAELHVSLLLSSSNLLFSLCIMTFKENDCQICALWGAGSFTLFSYSTFALLVGTKKLHSCECM